VTILSSVNRFNPIRLRFESMFSIPINLHSTIFLFNDMIVQGESIYYMSYLVNRNFDSVARSLAGWHSLSFAASTKC